MAAGRGGGGAGTGAGTGALGGLVAGGDLGSAAKGAILGAGLGAGAGGVLARTGTQKALMRTLSPEARKALARNPAFRFASGTEWSRIAPKSKLLPRVDGKLVPASKTFGREAVYPAPPQVQGLTPNPSRPYLYR